jgi:hypothetical protein
MCHYEASENRGMGDQENELVYAGDSNIHGERKYLKEPKRIVD